MDPAVAAASPRPAVSAVQTPAASPSSKLSWRAPTKAAISSPSPTVADALASASGAVPASYAPRTGKQTSSGQLSGPISGNNASHWASPAPTAQQQQQHQPVHTPLQSPFQGPRSSLSNVSTPSIATQNLQSYFAIPTSTSQPSSSSSPASGPSYNGANNKNNSNGAAVSSGKNAVMTDLITSASTSSSPYYPSASPRPLPVGTPTHTSWSSSPSPSASSLPSHYTPAIYNGRGTTTPPFPQDTTGSDLPPHVLAQLAASLSYAPNQPSTVDSGATNGGSGIAIPHHFTGAAAAALNNNGPNLHHPHPHQLAGPGLASASSSYPYYNPLHNFTPSGM